MDRSDRPGLSGAWRMPAGAPHFQEFQLGSFRAYDRWSRSLEKLLFKSFEILTIFSAPNCQGRICAFPQGCLGAEAPRDVEGWSWRPHIQTSNALPWSASKTH